MAKKPKRNTIRLSEERIGVRLPRTLLERVDAIAVESLCPRSYAIRRLIMRGLDSEVSSNRK